MCFTLRRTANECLSDKWAHGLWNLSGGLLSNHILRDKKSSDFSWDCTCKQIHSWFCTWNVAKNKRQLQAPKVRGVNTAEITAVDSGAKWFELQISVSSCLSLFGSVFMCFSLIRVRFTCFGCIDFVTMPFPMFCSHFCRFFILFGVPYVFTYYMFFDSHPHKYIIWCVQPFFLIEKCNDHHRMTCSVRRCCFSTKQTHSGKRT